MIGDALQRQLTDSMVMEISRLKEQLNILEQRLSIQIDAEEHGYFWAAETRGEKGWKLNHLKEEYKEDKGDKQTMWSAP